MKKLIALTAMTIAFFCVALNVVGQDKQPVKPADKPVDKQPVKEITIDEMKGLVAVMTTNFGVIKIKFYPDEAPNTSRNFITLVNKKFYDGLTFHRVVKDFMIQGGCPLGNGQGGPGYAIKAEFNKIKHVPGTVSMARTQDPNSAGSQFFICQGQPSPFLDNQYTAFGQVIEGQDVVDKIASSKLNGESPVEKVIMKSVVIEKIAKEAPKPVDNKSAPAAKKG